MSVRVALFQAQSGIDPEANARRLADMIHASASAGARMLFTPEMTGLLDRDRERSAGRVMEEADDVVLAKAREAARHAGIWVHLGSLALRGVGDRLVNRSFVIDDSGEIVGRYDKIHLFDVDLPSGESWRESASYNAGSRAVIVEGTPVGRLGLTICYDLRFPALWAALAEGGADVIACPAAFTVPTGQAHWHLLLRARAVEAGLFVIAAAQGGSHEDGRSTFGHSLVVGPWGDVLLDMEEAHGTVGLAEIDPAAMEDVRARLPALRHRRAFTNPGN
jgi:predicted amidohydrolase